jgi:hypothetical protein
MALRTACMRRAEGEVAEPGDVFQTNSPERHALPPLQRDALNAKFSSLEADMQGFSSQTQARRESLDRPLRLLAAAPQPSAAASMRNLASGAPPPWAPGARAAAPVPPPTLETSGSQDDDAAVTGSLNEASGLAGGAREALVRIPGGPLAACRAAKVRRRDPNLAARHDSDLAPSPHALSLPQAPRSSDVPLLSLLPSAQAAVEAFEEPGLVKLVVEGLHKQLQRTKDGATEASRIKELAGAHRDRLVFSPAIRDVVMGLPMRRKLCSM